MPRMIKRSLSRISPKARVTALTLLAAIAIGVGVAWVVARATQPATSEEPNPVADFSQRPLTPPPMTVVVATRIPESETGCAGPENEVPGPGLPPLPCHMKSNEPPPDTIPTASPEEHPAALASTQNVPKGWQVYDNPMFRYTFALPPDWYANMRPEGGEFQVFDSVGMEQFATGESKPGGLVMFFAAWLYEPGEPSLFTDTDAKRVDTPNAKFGDYDGAIWEDPDATGLGVVRVIRFAFLRDSIAFTGKIHFGEGYTEEDVAAVCQILTTITPY